MPEFISARARLRSISANLHGVDRGEGAGGEEGGDKGWALEDDAHGAIGGLAPGSGGQRHEPAANSLLLMSGPKTIYTVRGGLKFPEIVVAQHLGRGGPSTSSGAQHLSGGGGMRVRVSGGRAQINCCRGMPDAGLVMLSVRVKFRKFFAHSGFAACLAACLLVLHAVAWAWATSACFMRIRCMAVA